MKIKLATTATPEPVEVELQAADNTAKTIATIAGERHEADIERIGSHEGIIRLDNNVHRFVTHREEDRILVWLDGETYEFNAVNKVPRRSGSAASAAAGNEISAPMPGTILKILVGEGESVTANQPLIIMESMKMEMTLSATTDTTIKQIHCTESQLVERDATLITLESADKI